MYELTFTQERKKELVKKTNQLTSSKNIHIKIKAGRQMILPLNILEEQNIPATILRHWTSHDITT